MLIDSPKIGAKWLRGDFCKPYIRAVLWEHQFSLKFYKCLPQMLPQ